MDAIFGRKMFRNEIVWCYRGGGVPRTGFARKHDLIFRLHGFLTFTDEPPERTDDGGYAVPYSTPEGVG